MIGLIKKFFSLYEMFPSKLSRFDFMDYIGFLAVTAFYALILFLVVAAIYGIYRAICYKSYYTEVTSHKGTVADMKYVPPKTRTVSTGKTTTTTTTPAKNYVYIEADGFDEQIEINSDYLYQRVRVDEDVKLTAQKRYNKPRFWYGPFEFAEVIVLTVTNIKGKVINVNDAHEQTVSDIEAKRGY